MLSLGVVLALAASYVVFAPTPPLAPTQVLSPLSDQLLILSCSQLTTPPASSYISHFWSHDRPIFKVLVVFLVLLSIADASSLASWGFSWAVMAWSDPESVTLLPVEATLYVPFSLPPFPFLPLPSSSLPPT